MWRVGFGSWGFKRLHSNVQPGGRAEPFSEPVLQAASLALVT